MCPESYGVTPHTYIVSGLRARGVTATFRRVSVSRTRSSAVALALTRCDGGVGAQRLDLVRLLPRHPQVVATEVPVRRRRPVDRPQQVHVGDDRAGPKVEVASYQSQQLLLRLAAGAEGLDGDRRRVRAADRVGDLHLAPLRQPCGDEVLGHVAGGVGRRTVDLARVLAAERAAAVAGDAAVGVDDDLAPGQPGIRRGPAEHEGPARVDQDRAVGVDHLTLEDRVDHERAHALGDLLLRRAGRVVRGDDDRLDALRPAKLVLHRDLRLAVGAQERQLAVFAYLGQLLGQPVRERDREGHELGRLAAGEADHHPLVAGALQLEGIGLAGACALLQGVVDARRDVGRLLLQVDLDQRMIGVEADRLVAVPDSANRVPDGALDVESGVGRDLADDDAKALRDRGLARDARSRVLLEHAVEHGVRDLVADLVRVAFGD